MADVKRVTCQKERVCQRCKKPIAVGQVAIKKRIHDENKTKTVKHSVLYYCVSCYAGESEE